MPITVRRFLSLPARVGDAAAAGRWRGSAWRGLAAEQMTTLSGGQFQRVLLARALLGAPQLLMLDEPTQGLDQPGEAAFYRLIEEVRTADGCAVLMVSHDLHVVMAASDRVICLNGHVCCEGTPRVVSTAPEYRALFGLGTQGALALYRHEHDHDHAATGTRITTTTTRITTTTMTMLDDFLVRAGLAGSRSGLATGPLGAFVVWRRMAYFGDATAHAAVLGVALALATDLPIGLGTLVVALAMAVTVAGLSARGWAMDTTLGVLAHSALAFGLVAVSFFPACGPTCPAICSATSSRYRGPIWPGLAGRAGGAGAAGLALAGAADRDAERGPRPCRGHPTRTASGWCWTLALALVVAVALKVVGALLIAAMLIVPAAAARSLRPHARGDGGRSRSLIGALSGLGGLALSLWRDTPTGPSIIVVAAVLFALSALRRPGNPDFCRPARSLPKFPL